MTDADWLLDYLQRYPQGIDAMQAQNASLRERDQGLMVHSRAADLRKRGYTITCGIEGKTRKGRDRYVYRLVDVAAPGGSVESLSGSALGMVPESNPDQVRPLEQLSLT